MKIPHLSFTLLLACSLPAWSHEAPIPPNEMTLTADAGQVRVHFRTGAPWWVMDVLNQRTPPPTGWPEATQNAVKTYFDRHFVLRADGKPLASTLTGHRYSEEVWKYTLGAQLHLDFSYALPPEARELSGEASFYKEDAPLAPADHFRTTVQTSGPAAQTLLLTLEKPTFSLLIAGLIRTPAQRRMQAFLAGLRAWQTQAWIYFIVAALQLQLRVRLSPRLYIGATADTAVLAAAFLAWRQESALLFGLGAALVFLLAAAGIEGALRLYYRRLLRASQSQAERLFRSQVQFLSLLSAGIALFLLGQSAGKRA